MSHQTQRPAWNLLTGTLAKYALLFVNIVLGIFLMPFTMHHLGKAEYGLWMLAASMTAYLQLLDLGYGSGLVRQLTQADARGAEDEMNVILSTFFVIYTAIGIVALLAVGALTVFVVPLFPNLSAPEIRTAQWVVAILGVRTALAFPMSLYGAVTTARQRFALTGWIAVGVALLQGAATYIVLRSGYGLVTLVAVSTIISAASYAAYIAAAKQTFPELRMARGRFSTAQAREVTAFSLYLFLIGLAGHVALNLDNLVIGAYLGTSAIAVYTVASRLADYQRQLCGQFSGLLFPVVVRFDAGRDAAALKVTLLDGTRITLGLVVGVTVCLIAFGDVVISRWMGAGFAESVAPLYALALLGIVVVGQGPAGSILLATGRHRLVALASVIDIILKVTLTIALVRPYGLVGVALGTLIPYALLNVGVLIPAACRSVGVSVRAFAAAVTTPSTVAALPAALIAILLRAASRPESLAAIVVESMLVGTVYLMAFCLLGLRSGDRTRYLGSMRRMALASFRPRAVTS